MNDWSEDVRRFKLDEQFDLEQADAKDWGIYYSVYYNMDYNGFFKDQGLTMNNGRRKFWIYNGEKKVGGVVIVPNVIFGLFFIPPFHEETKVFQLLKNALLHWSNRTKDITAYEILPNQIELFARAGFWPGEFRCRWMQRPAEILMTEWDETLKVCSPELSAADEESILLRDAEAISELSYRVYRNTLEDVRRKQTSREDYNSWMEHYPGQTNESLLQASSFVYDRETSQLVGICLISSQDDMPAVYNIAVAPSHQGRGIATKMLQRAVTVLKQHDYPLLRLYVMQGNKAEALYHQFGFIAGPLEVQTCHIPALHGTNDSLN
ncbi:GNAT family N-acetyltransferase [Paenibacillus sp. CF384]|uniref:GNAT family N-acetyltransferase n=1 Tax=Paenibacillus sp. CF384 TaxID=1884382 RepID=UPI000895D303|nr:GNAT family N-acetyltransferase [Paenibacillus sp. CF384]SDX80531.1 Ribosomal protein S18 acetylase RimI [Paenibacillus sp. CF384]